MATGDRQVPKAREEELLVHELADEMLVYDLKRHQAHSLNRTAALVWRQCDGKTSPAEMTALLQRELNLPADEDAVWAVLRRLGKAHLLEERIAPPADGNRCSRREIMRKLGMVGGLALVTSIVAPTPAQAASCITKEFCRAKPAGTCGNVPCDPTACTKTCQVKSSTDPSCTCKT